MTGERANNALDIRAHIKDRSLCGIALNISMERDWG
jgi:hypothetical protein